MDTETYEIINLFLSLIISIFTFITSYRTTRKMMTFKTRKDKKKDIVNTLDFIQQHASENSGKLKSNDEMLRLLLAHFKLSGSE